MPTQIKFVWLLFALFFLCTVFALPTFAANRLTVSVSGTFLYGQNVVINVKYQTDKNVPIPNSQVKIYQVAPTGEEVELKDATNFTNSSGELAITLNGTIGDLTAGNKNYVIETGGQKQNITVTIGEYAASGSVATLSGGTDIDGDAWYKFGDKIVLNAPSGFEISNSFALVSNTWSDDMSLDAFGVEGEANTITYYLKNTASGAVSIAKTAEYYFDMTAPTGVVKIGDSEYDFFSTATYIGLFYNKAPSASVTASDGKGAGVDGIYYYIDKTAEANKASLKPDDIDWNKYSSSSNPKFSVGDISVIYVKIVDKVGNETLITSDGVVVYEESDADTTKIEFTKMGSRDVTASVKTNGNTIDEIAVDGSSLGESDFSQTSSGSTTTVTFTHEYLDSLDIGEYDVTVSYKPLGEEYFSLDGSDSVAPAKTEMELIIEGKTPDASWKPEDQITAFSGSTVTYTGETDLDKGESTGSVTYKYYTSSSGGRAMSEAPTEIGKYYVEAVIAADENYIEFAIKKRAVLYITDEDGKVDGKEVTSPTGTSSGSAGSGSNSSSGNSSSDDSDNDSESEDETSGSGVGSGGSVAGGQTFFMGTVSDETSADDTEDMTQNSTEGSYFASAEIEQGEITWLETENGVTLGVDNTDSEIPVGALFWVKVANSERGGEDWAKYYARLSADDRKSVTTETASIFSVRVLLSDGSLLSDYEGVTVYIEVDDDHSASKVRALQLEQGRSETLPLTQNIDMQTGSGKKDFWALELSDFTPFIVYEEIESEEPTISENALTGMSYQPAGASLYNTFEMAGDFLQNAILILLAGAIAFGAILFAVRRWR